MVLALVLALMMAVAIFAVLWPLSRGRETAPPDVAAEASDVAVYRDQLEEIERDRNAGMIAAPEAQAAQIEVSRRLIAAAQPAGNEKFADSAPGQLWRRRVTALAALVLMPASAAVLYLALGSPGLPGQALSERADTRDQNSLPAMIARVEARLEQAPDDGRGWEVVAPVYMRLGRYEDAVRADRNVIRLLGETSARLGDLGEALVLQANGVITAEAKAVFEQIVARDGTDARAQFYVGRAAEQDGRPAEAAKTWRAMIEKAPADAPWLPAVREALSRVAGQQGATSLSVATGSNPSPSADDVAAAAEMPSAERDKMVRGMVDRLAARLHDDGSDVDGWLRLMRAHVVLGERDKASAAAAEARRALKDAPEKLRQIDDSAKSFGLGG
jgi:cytochrome c-type biogenesis protein CcmH